MNEIANSALMVFLSKTNPQYFGKALELREAVEGWLSYIPQTFPHYTRHTVQHSDEIIMQISKIIFEDSSNNTPVIDISPTEAYILIACAFLHDAGMVVSDQEKYSIIRSEEWEAWTTSSGAGAERWQRIQEFRKAKTNENAHHDFIADIQTRYLIAEFLRRTHHLRAASVITQHQANLGRFAFDDPMLLRTITDVCVAHGLRQHELDDNERFPDRCDIKNDKVNVKFVAILLRLGDLLDVSYDRACPLLLNAACPLPPESLAHWTQYKRIVHRLTAPDRIALIAECETQEEHRYIQDWCQWLVDELHEARYRMARAGRHQDWNPPKADFDTDITIRPSRNANYIPSKWSFEIDKDAVFKLLIKDAYQNKYAFIRELIQNALDATRCKMIDDIIEKGVEPPEFPTKVGKNIRDKYPLNIKIIQTNILNDMSSEYEERNVLIIEDYGIGMDRDVIERYFLQVGRSYYTTDEFMRNYRFVPTSRFGVGFLSVFGAADLVTVNTLKFKSGDKEGAVRLTLTGPRNYLLTEKSSRRTSGTQIEILLRETLEKGEITKIISQICRKVEFPIYIDDFGENSIVEAEVPEQFVFEMADVTDEKSKFILRTFPVNRPGIEGELYVFARLTSNGESWGDKQWVEISYPQLHPAAERPIIPNSINCLHGLIVNDFSYSDGKDSMINRLDYRGKVETSLSRDSINRWGSSNFKENKYVENRWEELLLEHISSTKFASGNMGWVYKQKLVDGFYLKNFWMKVDEMIPLYSQRGRKCVSLAFMLEIDKFSTIITKHEAKRTFSHDNDAEPQTKEKVEIEPNVEVLMNSDIDLLSEKHSKEIFVNRVPTNFRMLSSSCFAIDWIYENDEVKPIKIGEKVFFGIEIPDDYIVGFTFMQHRRSFLKCTLLNTKNQFVCWLLKLSNACEKGNCVVTNEKIINLIKLFSTPIEYSGFELEKLVNYVEAWVNLPKLEQELRPSSTSLKRDMFEPFRLFATTTHGINKTNQGKPKRARHTKKNR